MLRIYNTMTRSKEDFLPLVEGKVKMFTCGPSIYRRPHAGNYRSFLWEDVLQRFLEHLGYEVERVINFTDVEDKAIAEAEKEGQDVATVTGRIADQFFKDARLLRIELPDFIPRSSTSVDKAVELIQILIEKECAYWHEGSVYFDPLKLESFGKLFRLDMSKWPKEKKRFKRDTYPGRRWNLGDFILWHGYRQGDKLFWDTPIGKGRPSWNIQDPAMITKHLGHRVDICCGGIDNLYRHHDYNIAVIEAASGEEFCHFWVHGEHLLADGKKMSKSRGNIVYPEDLTEQGYSAQQVRFFLLYGHHRKQMNMTRKAVRNAADRLNDFNSMVAFLLQQPASSARQQKAGSPGGRPLDIIDRLLPDFEERLSDDLDVKGAFDKIFEHIASLLEISKAGGLSSTERAQIERNLRQIDGVIQVMPMDQDNNSRIGG